MTVIDVLILTAAALVVIMVAGVLVLSHDSTHRSIEVDTVTRGQN